MDPLRIGVEPTDLLVGPAVTMSDSGSEVGAEVGGQSRPNAVVVGPRRDLNWANVENQVDCPVACSVRIEGSGFNPSAPQCNAGAESVNVNEAPVLGFYWVVASVFWGGLIVELSGISGGSGGRLTNRSGWAV